MNTFHYRSPPRGESWKRARILQENLLFEFINSQNAVL